MDKLPEMLVPYLLRLTRTQHDYPLIEVEADGKRDFGHDVSVNFAINSLHVLVTIPTSEKMASCVKRELCTQFSRQCVFLRNSPLQNSDLTFLVTAEHVLQYGPENIAVTIRTTIDEILEAIEPLERELQRLLTSSGRNSLE